MDAAKSIETTTKYYARRRLIPGGLLSHRDHLKPIKGGEWGASSTNVGPRKGMEGVADW
jgi:hypothetical protein